MHKISDLAGLFHITTKTVRLYEELGLISQGIRDPINNYRYFSEMSAYELSLVLQYKDMGFTLTEISSILAGTFSFTTNQENLLLELEIIKNKLVSTSAFSTDYFSQSPKIFDIPQTPVLYLSLKRSNLDEKSAFSHLIAQAIGEKLELKPTSCFFSIFENHSLDSIKDNDQDNTICLALSNGQFSNENFMVLPATKFASIIYNGPYDDIGKAKEYLADFVSSQFNCNSSTIYQYYINQPCGEHDYATIKLMIPIS